MRKIISAILVVFLVVLVASVVVRLALSPDFRGFGVNFFSNPALAGLSGEYGGAIGARPEYNWRDHPVFIVGDSLTVGASNAISDAVGPATIDAKVSRNMATGLSILEGWAEKGILTDDAVIVVCLANNITGTTVSDAQKVVDMIRPGQSLIMMTGHGLSVMAPANEFIRNLPNEYHFITVADWDMTISQSPGLLADDGIHVSKKQGNELYADLILRALEVARPKQY